MGRNFNAVLMEIVFLSCGAVMEKRTVKMVVMKKAVMEPYGCVMKKQSSPARVQVYIHKYVLLSLILCLCFCMWLGHKGTMWIVVLVFNATEVTRTRIAWICFPNLFSDLWYKMDGFWDYVKLRCSLDSTLKQIYKCNI